MELINAFDYKILEILHTLATVAGGFFTPLSKVVTFIGEKGLWLYLLAFILMCFPKYRKIGICLFGAVSCGVLVTSFILKDAVARPRPFDNTMYPIFKEWWVYVDACIEDGFSFPSGHVTAATAGMTALCLIYNKKTLWGGIPYVLLMCFARCYLMAHHPSDCLAGVLVGVFSGIVAYFITLGIYAFLNKFKGNKICDFILNKFDASKLWKNKSNKKTASKKGK